MATDHNFKVKNGLTVEAFTVHIDGDGTYGDSYSALGFGGTTNAYSKILAAPDSGSHLYINAGGNLYFRTNQSSDNKLVITTSGNIQMGSTTIIDSSRNLTNIGSLALSSSITLNNNQRIYFKNSSGTTNSSLYRAGGNATRFEYADNAFIFDSSDDTDFEIRNSSDANVFRVDVQSTVANTSVYSAGNFNAGQNIQTNGTTRITSAGNLTNIGSITASGNLQAQNATFTGTGDVTVKIIADTDNVTETDNPTLGFSQDGNTAGTLFVIGLEGNENTVFHGSKVNSPYIHANVGNVNHPLSIGNNGKLVAQFNSTASSAALTVTKFSDISGTNGSTILSLNNYMGSSTTTGDLSQQKSFIDFQLLDSNANEVPQVRIGAEVGENGDANDQNKEGSGAFVVYTNDADTTSGDAGSSLTEKLRVDYQGNVGIGTASPSYKLDVNGTGRFLGEITVNGGGNQSVIKSSSDAPLIVESTDAYSGINFKDTGGNSSMFYHGASDHLYLHSATFSVAGSTIATNFEFQVNGDANLTGGLAIGGNTVITSARNMQNIGNLNIGGYYAMDGVTIIDTSKNLTNIGTISSGAITSSGTLNLTSGNIRLRNNVTGDGQTIRDIDFLTSAAEGTSDDRVAIVRGRTSAGTSTTRGGALFFYTRQANGSGFNQTTIDHAGNLTIAGNIYLPQYLYHVGDTDTYIQFLDNRVRIFAGGTAKFDSNNTYQTTAAPSAVSITSSSVVSETVEIVFSQSSTSGVSRYEIWSDGGGSDFSLVGKINAQDAASSMSFVDTTFTDTGTINYRVYAVRYGIYSTAATTSVSFSQPSLDVTNFSAIADLNNFYLQYEKPDTRFLDHIEIYVDTDASSSNLARSSASLIYSGDNTSYVYTISASDRNNFHQFWVECVGV